MITGSLKAQVDKIWDSFWSGGISNPITVIEQFMYLLFMRQLDDRQIAAEKIATAFGSDPDPSQVFYPPSHQDLRWRQLVAIEDPQVRFDKFTHEGFPYVKQLGQKDGSGFAEHMRDAALQIPNASTLGVVTSLISKLDFTNKDMSGDLYEYMLSKLSTSGTNGQFRTPSHIIDLIVALADPKLGQRIIDPACGTAGFLASAAEYTKPDSSATPVQFESYQKDMFYGFDFDSTMVRIAAMNMVMHGFNQPNIEYQDSLQELDPSEQGAYDVVLANPTVRGQRECGHPGSGVGEDQVAQDGTAVPGAIPHLVESRWSGSGCCPGGCLVWFHACA